MTFALPLAAWVLLLGLACPTAARAETFLLLPEVGGDGAQLSLVTRLGAVNAVKRHLEANGHQVVDLPRRAREADRLCTEAACARALATRAQADGAVSVSLFREPGRDAPRELVITVYGPEDSSRVGRAQVTEGALDGAVGRAWAELSRGESDGSGRQPLLHVHGSPSGAAVFLDGQEVGALEYREPVEPGRHELRVEMEGFISEERRLDVPDDPEHVEDIAIDLAVVDPPGGEVDTPRPPPSEGISSWAMPAGISLAVVGAATAILVPVVSEATTGCLDDGVNTCPEATRLDIGATVGWAIAGGLVFAVGLTLIIVSALEPDEPSVRANVGPSGLTIEGSF